MVLDQCPRKEHTTERLTQAIDFFRNKIHQTIVADNAVFTENKSEIEEAIKEAKEKYMRDETQAMKELKALFQTSTSNGNSDDVLINDSSDDDLDENRSSSMAHSPTSVNSTRGGGRVATRVAGTGRGRGRRGSQATQGTLDNLVKVSRQS